MITTTRGTSGARLLGIAIAFTAAGCVATLDAPPGSDDGTGPVGTSPDMSGDGPSPGPSCTGDPLALLDKGATQLASLCARGYGDPISKAFCGATPPTLTSVSDVAKLVGLGFKTSPPYSQGTTSGMQGNPSYILTAQTTSLSTRRASQLNPRMILFTPPLARGRMTGAPKPNPSYVAMGFTRGEQTVELLAKDPTMNGGKGDIRFFLLKYELPCDTAPGGCTAGDLYTPAVESGFASWSLYDDSDLKDTPVDCLQCHQSGGPGTPRMLRQQELQRPWQHWMYNDSTGIAALRADFHAAHGTTEAYGSIPGAALDFGDVQQLEGFVENNGFQSQPNEFQGATILSELTAMGTSPTWQSLYQKSESGQFIPVPYYDFRATDPTMVQSLIGQYKAVVAGTLPKDQLGDMAAVFTDPAQRAMTHKPALGLTGRQILVQVCQQCHNSHLDQTISRARFNVEQLDTLARGEKDEAIRRVGLPLDACSHMPPVRFRELDAAEIGLVQAELMK
jgi:mono/diheme cytochrome c family protein